MILPLVTSKISYNNVLKLLELAVPGITYIELVNHPYSGYYSTFADTLNELHYDRPINYRNTYKFLLNNVWNKQDEHQYFSAKGKIRYTKLSFLADADVKELAPNRMRVKPESASKKTKKIKKPTSKTKEIVETIRRLLLEHQLLILNLSESLKMKLLKIQTLKMLSHQRN
jgi:hypothetical protein